MSDIRVPIKTWLRGPTYRRLSAIARAYNFADVGSLLEHLAERAVAPSPPPAPARRRKPWTPFETQLARDMRDRGLTYQQIADQLDRPLGTVYDRLTKGPK